jgi:RNA polymerase sigma-70 factor (ECF subfamily)
LGNDELEELYCKYYKELYLYAFSLCRNYDIAQDLVSDTFFKALLSMDDSRQYIKYWLFRVCKNLYLDYLKKNKCLEDLDIHMDKLFIEDSIIDRIVLDEERKKTFYGILKLKSSYKEIIILYYYSNFTLKEIAAITDISEGAARTLLFRARQKLKEVLKEE